MLTEQNYGLFSGEENTEANENKYPLVYSYYRETINKVGRFYTRMPYGESEFDMASRANHIVNKIKEIDKNKKYKAIIIVTHHNFIRVLMKTLLNKDISWYENENGPCNCGVQKIEINNNSEDNKEVEDHVDYNITYLGYIHGGKLEKWMV